MVSAWEISSKNCRQRSKRSSEDLKIQPFVELKDSDGLVGSVSLNLFIFCQDEEAYDFRINLVLRTDIVKDHFKLKLSRRTVPKRTSSASILKNVGSSNWEERNKTVKTTTSEGRFDHMGMILGIFLLPMKIVMTRAELIPEESPDVLQVSAEFDAITDSVKDLEHVDGEIVTLGTNYATKVSVEIEGLDDGESINKPVTFLNEKGFSEAVVDNLNKKISANGKKLKSSEVEINQKLTENLAKYHSNSGINTHELLGAETKHEILNDDHIGIDGIHEASLANKRLAQEKPKDPSAKQNGGEDSSGPEKSGARRVKKFVHFPFLHLIFIFVRFKVLGN